MSEFYPTRPDREGKDFTKPRIEQATRPERSTSNQHSVRSRLRSLLLAAGVTTAAVAGTAVVINEYDKGAQNHETLAGMLEAGEIAGIDTSTYQIDPYVDKSLIHFRKGPNNKAEDIDLAKIRTINGLAWDGQKPVVIKNSPYTMGIDPYDGVGQDAWLAVELEMETLLGNEVHTIGFINNGRATEKHFSVIDQGKIAHPTMDANGNVAGTLDSGRHIPAERIALGLPAEPQPKS
jgi:hypothetical protein